MTAQFIEMSRGCAGLRLLVRNHAGVMSHVCGLFARRAFNLEAILCLPLADARHSLILLSVNEDERLDQLLRQLRKLEDVLEIERCSAAIFNDIAVQAALHASLPAAAAHPLLQTGACE